MKSFSSKVLILTIGCLTLTCAIMGGAGIYTSRQVISQDSAQIMNLLCTRETQALNTKLAYVEQSVNTLAMYADAQVSDTWHLKDDKAYVENLLNNIETVAANIVRSTEAARTVYFRLNPDLFSPKSGFFFTKNSVGLTRLPLTDLSLYTPSQTEYVGWYYAPVEKMGPTWIDPYLNRNINTWIISYVIPVYAGDIVLGVVGMDINFETLTETVEKTQVYHTGYAFLVSNDGRALYHKDIAMNTLLSPDPHSELTGLTTQLVSRAENSTLFSYTYKGVPKRMTFQNLRNDLKFVLTAPAQEIDAKADELLVRISLFTITILLVASVWTYAVTTRLVAPLHELNKAARKIAAGDLSVVITHRSEDEVGALAESFRRTTRKLKQYINKINALAYKDTLTGCKNNAAYMEIQSRINDEIKAGTAHFSLLVFDLNNLKRTNDSRGHDYGDKVIINAARLICMSFKHSPVFRIGGDEFVVVLEKADNEQCQSLLELLDNATREWNATNSENLQLSAARGLGEFTAQRDTSFHDVFRRADTAMYAHKASMKSADMGQGTRA